MATQFASIAPIPFPAPRSVRIAYSAGTAATAVHDKIADLPAHKRDATLEELSVIALADQVVAQARDLLSPRVFAAFVEWAEAATLAETDHGDDDNAASDKIDRLHAALRSIGRANSTKFHDVALKSYIAMIEYGDRPSFGPVIKTLVDDPGAQLGLIDDLLYLSPLLNPLNQLAATAWWFSPYAALARNIGEAIAARFAEAGTAAIERVPASVRQKREVSSSSVDEWNTLAAAYFKAKAVEDAYDREFCSIDESLPTGAERSAAVQAIPRAHWDESQRLGEYRLGLEEQLLREPASTPAVFAMKVLICRGERHSDDMDEYDAMLVEDARAIVDAAIAAADLPPRSAFAATLARYQSFRQAYEAYYKDVLLPAHARYEEGTKQWPTGYDYASDPIAKAARDAVSYDAIEDHSDELVSAYVDAMLELLIMPAPDVAGLAIKLEILKKEEGSTLTRIDEIVDQLAADARAIAGGVSPLEVQ